MKNSNNPIVAAILEVADINSPQFTLLNWDGSQTSVEELSANLHNYVTRITGWPQVKVEIGKEVFSIHARDSEGQPPMGGECLLSYTTAGCGREIYGRLRHLGITYARLLEIESVMATL